MAITFNHNDQVYVKDGNLGVGTNSPEARVHIKITDSGATPISQQHLILEHNSATGLGILTTSATSGYIFFGDESDAQRGYISYNHPTDDMSFKVAGSERMRISSDGNVGIGTTSPSEKLHVAGVGLFDGGRQVKIHPNDGYVQISAPTTGGWATRYSFTQRDGTNIGGYGAYGSTGLTYFWIGNAYNTPSMVVNSSGNVGIGTTSPGAKLDVAGNILISGEDNQISFYSSSQTGYRLYRNSTTMTLRSDGNIKEDAGSTYIVSTNAAERLRVDSSGNVGIGTTSPGYKLEVAGTIAQTSLGYTPNDDLNDTVYTRFIRSHTATLNTPVSSFGMGINLEFGSGNSMQLISSRSSADALYMRKQSNSSWGSWIKIRDNQQITDTDISNWNAGYANWSGTTGGGDWNNVDTNAFLRGHTTTLNYPPEVNQSFLSGLSVLYSTGNGWQLASDRTANSNLYHRHVSNGTWYSWKRILDSDDIYVDSSNGNIGINTTSPSYKLHVTGDASVSTWLYVNNIYPTSSTNDLLLNTGAGRTITINPTSTGKTVIPNGNVGIGTTGPSKKLHIYTSDNEGIFLQGAGGGVWMDVQSGAGELWSFGADNGGAGIYNRTNLSYRFYVNNAGNVGIGKTSPAEKLDVNGRVQAERFRTTTGGNSTFAAYYFLGDADTGTFQPANNMFGITTAGSERMRIDSSGRVLISGTSTAFSDKLYVNNDAYATGGWRVGTASTYVGKLYNSSGVLTLQSDGARDIQFGGSTHGTRLFIDTSAGNIGINTSSPGSALDVNGTIRTTSTFQFYNTGGSVYAVGAFDASYYRFFTSGAERIRVDSAGNVGIGTSSPSYKLHVNGTIGTLPSSYRYIVNSNQIEAYSSGSYNLMMPLNGYLWHDLFAFDYLYTRTQEISLDGSTWSNAELQTAIFNQKQDQAITVIDTNEQAVRWTFQGVAWSVAPFLNIAFTYVSGDITKNILVESSADGITWNPIHDSVANPGIATQTCYLTNYGGDNYMRITIAKGVSSTNPVRISSLRLMTNRAGDQGQGMEYHYPYSWDSNRNIGIGTNVPQAKLDVAGDFRLTRRVFVTGDYIGFFADGGSAKPVKAGSITISNDYDDVAPTNGLYVKGNTGIGVASPSTKLEVASSGANGIDISGDAANSLLSGRLFLSNGTLGESVVLLNSSGDLTFRTQGQPNNTSGNERARITESGSLAVGTSSPAGRLHVAQDTGTVNELYVTQQKNYGAGTGTSERAALVLGISEASQSFSNRQFGVIEVGTESELSSADGFMAIKTRSSSAVSEKLRINSDGNVGIGTTSPSTSLQVNGVITATGGNSTNWNTAYSWGNHASQGYLTSETVTSLSLSANVLRYTDENGANTDLDLSLYLDDTNLARLTSGTLNGTTGIATFTRDDNSTFTVDFSAFLADANNYVDSLSFNTTTGVLTVGRSGSLADLTVDLDGRYLTSETYSTASELLTAIKTVDGSGSGLDADTLDGLNSSAFVSVIGDTMTGKLTVEGNGQDWDENVQGTTTGSIHLDPVGTGNDNTGSAITFGASDTGGGATAHAGIYTRTDGAYGTRMYFSTTDNYGQGSKTRMLIAANGNVGIGTISPSTPLQVNGVITATGGNSTNWNTAYGWGNHAGLYLGITSKAADSNLLDGLDSSAFLRSNASDVFTGQLTISGLIKGNGQELILSAGESHAYSTGQTDEYVYVNAEQGLMVTTTPDNWSSGWAGREVTIIKGSSITIGGNAVWHAGNFNPANYQPAGSYQPAGTYNTIIGTDSDINTSGSTIIDNIYVTDGVITSMGTRTLTAADLGIAKPQPAEALALTIVNDTINVTFNESPAGPDNYLIFSSVAGGDYGLISVLSPEDMSAAMSIIDNTFTRSGTIAYRVYAVKNGIYSDPATASVTFSSPSEDVSNLSSVSLNTAYYVQWNSPTNYSRFVDEYRVYVDVKDTQASLTRNDAVLVYQGDNTNYMYAVSGSDFDRYHQFWVEVIYR